MQWNGQIGPAFIVAVGLAVIQGLTLYSDSKAAVGERLAKVETKIEFLVQSANRKDQDRVNGNSYGR